MAGKDRIGRVQWDALHYPRLQDGLIHDLLLDLKDNNPIIYNNIVHPNINFEDDDSWFGSVTYFLIQIFPDDPPSSVMKYINITKVIWNFIGKYKNSGKWGGDF